MKKEAYWPRPSEWMSVLRPLTSERRMERNRFSPERSALLVIDMQRCFLETSSDAFIPAAEAIVGNARSIVEGFRSHSYPVIFTRHALRRGEEPGAMGRWWGDILYEDQVHSRIVPQFEPREDELVVRKTQYSAFVGTDLDKTLRAKSVGQIVVTGVQTHLCCESTARDAFMRGYDVFFVVDGTASKSEDLHLSSLKTLTEGVAMPVTTEEVLSWLR